MSALKLSLQREKRCGGDAVCSTTAIRRDDPGTSRQSGCPGMVFLEATIPSISCCRDVMLNQAAVCELSQRVWGDLREPWKAHLLIAIG